MSGRRVVRLLVQNPVTSIVLLILLGMDIVGHGLGFHQAMLYYFPAMRARAVYLIDEGDHWRLADPDRESFDELGQLLVDAPETIVHAEIRRICEEHGVWAPTRRIDGATVVLEPLGGQAFTDADELEMRGLIADSLAADFMWRDDAELIRQGDTVKRYALVSGYVNNVLSIVGVVLFVYSLGWMLRMHRWDRQRRARRLVDRGVCPSCSYATGDLDSCPECGLTRNEMERRAGRTS